jgi:hypothetical protein
MYRRVCPSPSLIGADSCGRDQLSELSLFGGTPSDTILFKDSIQSVIRQLQFNTSRLKVAARAQKAG